MLDEYRTKLEILEEYREALRREKLYSELVENLSGLLREVVSYYEVHGLEIPERRKVFRMMDRLVKVVDRRNMETSDGSYHRKDSDGELPEPSEDLTSSVS